MKRLSGFVGISLVCHLVLFFLVIDLNFSGRQLDSYDIYEVSIVSAGSPTKVTSKTNTMSNDASVKKYYDAKHSEKKRISEIKKDSAGEIDAPELSPASIEPVNIKDTEPEIPVEAIGKPGGQGQSVSGDVSSNQVNYWKASVKGIVDNLWKAPPEISIVDMTLKTTYLLKISRTGDLQEKRLLVSSGNNPFDRSVLLALSSVKTFPPPPVVLIAGQDSVEITMSFTPPKGAR